ncbi:MAG: hybrid sensor histidine kinase/response regulator [Ktedonobacteraceae bacterium]
MNRPYILIVDDDKTLLQALPQALALRIKDIAIDCADSASAALDLIGQHDYDAIVSDIKMPGMDGLTLLAKIKELRPNTPTLLITGHGEHNLAVQALRGGAYDFIQKPIDRDYFVAALLRAIQMHQLQRQVTEQQHALEQYAASLEETVKKRTHELLKANAAKDEFLSIASHELKTPLASLKGITQLLHRKLERQGSAEIGNIANMERSIRRMELLVNDLLDTSVIETGMLTLRCQRYDLLTLCQNVVDEYAAVSEQQVVFNGSDESLPVEVDMDRLSQVITNLLSNARKYSPFGSPISVTVERVGNEGIITVQDTGVGIPAEMLPHIFERFYRVPGIQVQAGSSFGLGLGLYISHKIVDRHGGRIEVQSAPDHGSSFSIVLPLLTAERKETEPRQNALQL